MDDCDWKPKLEMQFESEIDGYKFYNEYAGKCGFSVRKFKSNKNTEGETTNRVLVCSKEGFKSEDKRDYKTKNPRHNVRTGCLARMSINLCKSNGKYRVYHFKEEHNHPLVSSECVHMLPSQRKISESQACQIDLADQSGIPLSEAFELIGRQAGGRDSLGFLKIDQKNYLQSMRQKDMNKGDCGSILKYLKDSGDASPSFYYAVQLDSADQITNIFWADAQMRFDYAHFGDVLTFDTTYKINNEHRPLGVFVGYNHHRETTIFGAALLYDEIEDSFIWLFESFLEAMSNKHPKTVFTDQDSAMAKALGIVMPNTFHRLCIWHLMQNALRNVNHVFQNEEGVHSVLGRFFYDVEEASDFELLWDYMLDTWNLRENTWLKKTYEVRHKWAYAYVRGNWSAGIRSTQLSESFNAKLKRYLKSDHNLKQLFMHFDRVVQDKRHKELESEYALTVRLPKVTIPAKMVTMASEIYTKKIFEEFQVEYFKSIEAILKEITVEGDNVVFTIRDSDKSRKVTRDSGNNLTCNCLLFERQGILCCHSINVLREAMKVMELPDAYILQRWTRRARSERVLNILGQSIETDAKLQRSEKYRYLCSMFTKIASRACELDETYEIACKNGKELSAIVEDLLNLRLDGPFKTDTTSLTIPEGSGNGIVGGNRDNLEVLAKGLKKKNNPYHRGKRRIIGPMEKALSKATKSKKSKASSASHSQVDEICTTPNLSYLELLQAT